MKFLKSRKSLKKLSILALALLPLGYATAASAGPVHQTTIDNWQQLPFQTTGAGTGLFGGSAGLYFSQNSNSNDVWLLPTAVLSNPTVDSPVLIAQNISQTGWDNGIAQTSDGTVYVNSGKSNQITVIPTSGATSSFAVGQGELTQEVISPDGRTLYVADSGDYRSGTGKVWAVDLATKSSTVIYSGGYATQALTIDSQGNLFAGDLNSGNIIMIPAALAQSGTNTTVGNGAKLIATNVGSYSDGYDSNYLTGLAIDSVGNLWVGSYDPLNNQIAVIPIGDLLNAEMTGQTTTPQSVLTGDNPVRAVQPIAFLNGKLYAYTWYYGIWSLDLNQYETELMHSYVSVSTGPDTVSNLAVSTVGHTTLKLTWGSNNASDTQYVCTASNGVSVTVSGNSCVLKGFDLYHSGNYTVSVTAVSSQGQSDPVTLNVQL